VRPWPRFAVWAVTLSAAVGADVAVPPAATVIDGSGQTVYPGLIDGLTTLGLTEIGSVAGSVDVAEIGDVNPHAKAWIAVNPHSELLPVARANGVTAALAAPAGGLVSGQSALIRMAGTTPDALTLKTPVAMHVVYPSGRPSPDSSRGEAEPEQKTFEERQKDKKKNQEKDLRRLANLLEEAKAYGELLRSGPAAKPDLPMEALAPVARGEVPIVVRADAEDDIRGALAFATDHALKLIIAGGLEAWRCADVLKQRDVPVLMNVERLPGRESDPYDAAYANAARLHAAGVRFAIVSDDASQSRNLPYEAAMARRDLRRRRPHGLARRGQGRRPLHGHGRHHGPPRHRDPRLHRRRAPVPRDPSHAALRAVQGPALSGIACPDAWRERTLPMRGDLVVWFPHLGGDPSHRGSAHLP